jgi:acetyl-CoA synthetase
MSTPAFRPSDAQRESARVASFMREHNISDMATMRSRASNEPDWFWDAVVSFLDIPFKENFTKVLDDSSGMAWSKWFVGGKLNVVDACITRHAASRPGAVALLWEGDDGSSRSLSYRDLEIQVDALSALLSAKGVKSGDVVGIYMPMVPEIVVALFAVAKIGAIFLPLFSGYGVDAIVTRLDDSAAVALVTVNAFPRRGKTIDVLSVVSEARKLLPNLSTIVAFERLKSELPDFVTPWPSTSTETAGTVYVDSEHPLFIAYTSGTTGKPKGAVHVHGGFLAKIAEEVAFQTDVGEEDTLFWFTDMGWIMGPWEVIGGLANGATVALFEGAPDYPSVDRLWEFCESNGVTVLGASPTLIRTLMTFGEETVDKHDLSKLRILASTGEPWNEDPWWWYFKVVGAQRCPVINLSGGTEVGACFLSPHPNEEIAPMSLGGPALGMDIDVFDENGQPLRGAVGELVCKKPWPGMTRGLWNAPERFIDTYFSRWPNVWVHGDWASINDDGQWFLHGRSDDTIKVAGKRIGPAEIESAAVSHDLVVEAAAIGYPDEAKGEVIWLYVVLRAEVAASDELRQGIANCVADHLGKSFKPSAVKFTSSLPKTRNAKILRRAVRSVAMGVAPGDMTSLEDPATLVAIREAS